MAWNAVSLLRRCPDVAFARGAWASQLGDALSTQGSSARRFSAEAQLAAAPDQPPAQPAASGQAPSLPGAAPRRLYRPPGGSTLLRYGRDLTAEAAEGRLDPLLGREDVMQRALQILLRRTKNNPVLIGDPGVGKTAVVEGIAQLAVSPLAPLALQGRCIVALDVGAMVAGTQYRGAFEERLQGVLNDVRQAGGRCIVFVDEMHMLIDAGKVEGSMNAANLLKPALARGELRCIGATTLEEYRKYIETDAAFARRLQPVLVEEPSPEEAVAWLEGLKGRYEAHHNVRFTQDAVATAVAAAQRFISDRRLPDSAIDLLDEAAARAQLRASPLWRTVAATRTGGGGNSAGSDDVNSAAQEAVASTSGGSSPNGAGQQQQHGTEQQQAMQQQQQQQADQQWQWWLEGATVGRSPEEVRRILEWFGATSDQPLPGIAGHVQTAAARREKYLQQFGLAADQGVSAAHAAGGGVRERPAGALPCPHCGFPTPSVPGAVTVSCPRCRFTFLNMPPEKLQLGASLFLRQHKPQQAQHGHLPQQGDSAAGVPAAVAAAPASPPEVDLPPALLPLVSGEDILQVVSGAAGVPAEHVLALRSRWQSLHAIERALQRAVVGQPAAVAAVAAAVRLGSALGMQPKRKRPLVSAALLGPAGVGKSTLCRALAQALFGSDRALIRIDLAQAADKTAVSRLLGAPPGYVGYGDGGILTEAVRRRPHSVVVFENAQQAHHEVQGLLRQVLEEGELVDSMSRRADFRNAVVVLTAPAAAAPGVLGTGTGAGTGAGAGAGAEGEQAATSAPGKHATTSLLGAPGVAGPAAASAGEREANGHTSSTSGAQHSAAAAALQEPTSSPNPGSGSGRGYAAPVLPEDLLSLVDATVCFGALTLADVQQITQRAVEAGCEALEDAGIAISVSQAAVEWVARSAHSTGAGSGGGASSIEGLVRRLVLSPAADVMLGQRAQQAEEQQQGQGAGDEGQARAGQDGQFLVQAIRVDVGPAGSGLVTSAE